MSFAELGLSEAVAGALNARGISDPFPVQSMVAPDVLGGRDVAVKSPTGSGKTLAFGAPLADLVEATDRRPAGLILAPTRELASQIVDELRSVMHARALSIAPVYGGVGIAKQARLAAKAHVVVATPGRLLDLMGRGDLTLAHVKVLVLDEADRMLDMGFKPAVDEIVRETPDSRQTLLFSATLDGEVGRVAKRYTRDAIRHEFAPKDQRKVDIEHRFVRVRHEAKLDHLVSDLRDAERGRTLVFVRTKRGADRLVKRLGRLDVRAVAMHGDKSQAQREKALSRFESGRIDTLIATDVAARGIDVADITHVINFDAPGQREDYVHRVGRTARAGASGVGITFVVDDQEREIAKMGTELGLARELEAAGLQATQTRPAARSRQGHRGQGRRRR
jgi:ATP-dependent RNA helicase RhlE